MEGSGLNGYATPAARRWREQFRLSGHSLTMRRIVTLSRGNSTRDLRRVNERPAAPAGEPFPTRFDEIRGAVVPTNVGHSLRARCGFDRRRRIFLQSDSAWFVRFFSRIFAGHIGFFLAWTRAPFRSERDQARKRRAWNPALPRI